MKILALETSTEYCSVALWQAGRVVERSEWVGQKHSELLIPLLDALLQAAGVSLSHCNGIAFGAGPGSFTGVRIACGTTQGLALGAGLPVVGICTLLALAEASGESRVIAAVDARMGEIYFAAYDKPDNVWVTVCEPMLCKPEDAPELSGDDWVGVGSGFAAHGEVLQLRYATHLRGVDASAVPQATSVATLAARQFSLGMGGDAALAQPLYLRNKVALKTVEREQLAREKSRVINAA
ncbi:MAG: tRNA (adenosine(37)-N6)-threonylcarbamoyltransferase complex dimerization subunit type 1 TsaB [Gallionella sp.]